MSNNPVGSSSKVSGKSKKNKYSRVSDTKRDSSQKSDKPAVIEIETIQRKQKEKENQLNFVAKHKKNLSIGKHKEPHSLKALAAAVVCNNVNLYRGMDLEIPLPILSVLLKAVIRFNLISDDNLGFFLSDKITELDLAITSSAPNLTDCALGLLSVCCPALEKLSLDGWNTISEEGWEQFFRTTPTLAKNFKSLSIRNIELSFFGLKSLGSFLNLQYLYASKCNTLNNPEVLDLLAETLGNSLIGLDLKDINLSSDAIESLSNGFRTLQVLDISVSIWSPHSPYASSESLALLSRLYCLRKLYLSGLMFDNDSITAICKGCANLTHLILTWPDPNSEYVWSVKLTEPVLAQISNLAKLKELGLGYCHRIRAEQSLLTSLPFLSSLEKLNLSSVPGVGDNLIMRLAESCPNMRRLKLNDCVVNSCSLFALAKHCPSLEYLDVRGKNISNIQTDAAWHAIAEGCPDLQSVFGSISPESRLYLQLHCPRLKIKIKTDSTDSIEDFLNAADWKTNQSTN